MEAALQAYCEYLQASGVPFTVARDSVREPDHDSVLYVEGRPSPRAHHNLGSGPVLEVDAPSSALGSDHATLSLAHEIDRLRPELQGASFLDLGCGTGLLAIFAALLGAQSVATDIDPEAIRLSQHNAELNGVELDLRLGHLLEPLREDETFDIVVTNLPHKPHPLGAGLPLGQAGGIEGDRLWREAINGFKVHIPPHSRLLFFLHSLPHPRLMAKVAEDFTLSLRRWKLRWLQPHEYGELRVVFERRHAEKSSFLWQCKGRTALVAGVWEATRQGNKK